MVVFLIQFVNILFTVLSWAIIIRILVSWIPNLDPYHPAVRLLRSITDPILEPARRVIPPLGGFDISPIVVLVVLDFLIRPLITQLLRGLL